MDSSTCLNWFSRLLILGAVVAGLAASASGAGIDSRPPDVSDVAYRLSMTSAAFVSSPPDVRDAAAAEGSATPDVFERYAAAHPYGVDPTSSGLVSTPPDVQDAATALHSTPEGVKADGLRWQGIAQVYKQQESVGAAATRTPPDVQDAAAALHSIPSPVRDTLLAASAVSPTESPQGPAYSLGSGLSEYRDGTGFFAKSTPNPSTRVVVESGGFNWDDWAIGVGSGMGLALLLGVGLLVGRQQRHRVQPA